MLKKIKTMAINEKATTKFYSQTKTISKNFCDSYGVFLIDY